MAGNDTRFTPFGITDILKTQGQETCSRAHGTLAGELWTKTHNEEDCENTNIPETQIDCRSEDDVKTSETPKQTPGKISMSYIVYANRKENQ